MTINEAKLVRIAFNIGREAEKAGATVADGYVIADTFILRWQHDRPCYYAIPCLMQDRCPFDPVCNS